MEHSLYSWFELTIGFFGVIALFLVFTALTALIFVKRKKSSQDVKIEVKKINDLFKENKNKILSEILSSIELKNLAKEIKSAEKEKKKSESKNSSDKETKKKIFVLDFHGDIAAHAVTAFREQITALLQVLRPHDEIVVRLESLGGMVHAYGLAASQLARIREQNISLTICVDKVAASGGYMMACLADKIIAAPFAIIGSIGVIASLPNLNKLLRKNDIEYLEVTAGEFKRTLTPFGEITEKGKSKFQEQVNETHVLFKDHVKKYRSAMDIDAVATGEYWFATKAIEYNLVDEIRTSDDYLLSASKQFDVYHIFTPKKESMRDKFSGMFTSLFSSLSESASSLLRSL